MKNRILASLLVLCMVLALGLTACSNTAATTTTAAAEETTTAAAEETTTAAEGESEEETTAAEGEAAPATWENLSWEKDTSPVTFSLYLNYDWYSVDTWKGEVPDEITRLTGVSCEATKGSDPAVLMTHLAAQELSDIVFTDNNVEQFHDEEVLYAWNKLIPEYCPEFWDLVDPLEKINNLASDGNVYTFKTHYNDTKAYTDDNSIGNFGNYTLAYRHDIMEKLGLAVPTSVEELEKIFYTVNEKKAELGITMVYNPHPSWTYIIQQWMGCKGKDWDAENKKIDLGYRNEQQLKYYKLMNKWYRDGILVQDYLGVRPEDFFSRNESGQVFAAAYNAQYAYAINSNMRKAQSGGKKDDLTKPYFEQIIGHLTYEGKEQIFLSDYGTGWSSCFISTNCENPGRAICFMEFMKSPQGDQLTQFGIEGRHYELVDGKVKRTELYNNMTADEKTNCGIGPWYLQGSGWAEGVSWASGVVNALNEDEAYAAQKGNENRLINKKVQYQHKNPAMSFARVENEDEEQVMYAKITDQWAKETARMITATSEAEVDQIWAELQQYLTDVGLDAVEAKMTERYIAGLEVYQKNGYFTDIVVE